MKIRDLKKPLMVLGVVSAAWVPTGLVWATSTTMNATANFLAAIVLTPTSLQFGSIVYAGSPTTGSAGRATMTTASGLTYDGAVFSAAPTPGTTAAGDIAITASTGNAIQVACSASGLLKNPGGTVGITVNTLKVAKLSAVGGGGVACTGSGNNVLSFTYTTGTDDHVKVGGILDASTLTGPLTGELYSTANTGGSAITVVITYV